MMGTWVLFVVLMVPVYSQNFTIVSSDCRSFRFEFQDFERVFTCEPGKVFSQMTKKCQSENGFFFDRGQCTTQRAFAPQNATAGCLECLASGIEKEQCVFPHPDNCALFYNCSKTEAEDNLGVFEDECDYPNRFDSTSKSCKNFQEVQCNSNGFRRFSPLAPCDYRKNQCSRSAHCKPCRFRYASCVGKPDGIQPWEGRDWSPAYAECLQGVTLFSGNCAQTRSGAPRIFSPRSNSCQDLAQVPRQFGGSLDE